MAVNERDKLVLELYLILAFENIDSKQIDEEEEDLKIAFQ